MCPQISQIILGIVLSLLYCNPKETIGQNTELHNQTLVITAYERLEELYIDGQPQSLINGDNWNLPDNIILHPTNRLIAVYAVNLGDEQCAGVLASMYDGSFLTDNDWKCLPYEYPGWENLGFDDSSWPNAVEYGSNGNHSNCSQQQYIEDINKNSKWIWTSRLGDFTLYCRGYLPFCEAQSPCLNGGTCLNNDASFCQCLLQYTGAFCETELHNETLVITAYERLQELHIDGQQQLLTSGGTWNLLDYLQSQPTNRLIAVYAANLAYPSCGGVLASVYDGSLLTNDKWKCSPFADAGWTNLGFDDSSWPKAVEYGSNGNHSSCDQQQFFGDISENSKWIWTNNLNDFGVYFRGYLPFCETFSPCLNNGKCLQNDVNFCECLPQYTGAFCETELQNKTLIVTAYEHLTELYIDGAQQSIANGNNWNRSDYVQVPLMSRLVALVADNSVGDQNCGGVLASTYEGSFLTNNKWKCSTSNDNADWIRLGYDDSNWPNAYEYGSNSDGQTGCVQTQPIADISASAQWIWTDDTSSDLMIYCRSYFPFCENSSPCLNNGTCLKNDERFCECLPRFTGTFCETDISSEITTVEATSTPPSPTSSELTTAAYLPPQPCTRSTAVYMNFEPEVDAYGVQTSTKIIRRGSPKCIVVCQKRCSASIVTSCTEGPCRNDGTCIQLSTGYRCECPLGFTGTNCEQELDCDGVTCANRLTSYGA